MKSHSADQASRPMNMPAKFKAADVERALKVALKVGLSVEGIEIDKEGTIRVITGKTIKLEKRVEPEL